MSKVPRVEIADVLAAKSLKHGAGKKFGREVAAYLLSTRRTGELNSLLRDIQQAWSERGYVEVVAASAHPISANAKAEIKAKVRKLLPEAKQIIITEQYDPEVIGGVRVELANQQLDLTVENKLNKFKQLTVGKD